MKHFLKISATVIGLSLTTQSLYAGPMYAGYELNESTNIITGGGLEWLQWDVTDGMSINGALAAYSGGGWTVASNSQMATLFSTFFPAAEFGPVWDLNENTEQTHSLAYSDGDSLAVTMFSTLFGETYTEYTLDSLSDPRIVTAARYGEDSDNDGLYSTAFVINPWTLNSNGSQQDGTITLNEDGIGPGYSTPSIAVALVRTAEVPEPMPLVLLTLGLAGLTLQRRERAKT